ncbi:MAG: STAS domain-containing protein [Planctomycetes bacterium]|nr:STAS domain-containing protein [Planctomycetota bacterium]
MAISQDGTTDVETLVRGKTAVVRLRGAISGTDCPALRARLEETLAARPTRVVLAMDGLQFVSSAGLGVFLSLLKAAHGQGADVVVAAPQPAIRELFEITRLNRVFACFETEEDACAEVAE